MKHSVPEPRAACSTGLDAPAVVIGAGHVGLTVAHALRAQGVAPLVLEAEDRAGEPWRRRHPQLRLNTHRLHSRLPGRPLPASAGDFPDRDAAAAHVAAFAETLAPCIRYGVRVLRIDPEAGGWRIATGEGALRARHVVVATGRERIPHIPDWDGADRWPGRIIHAADLGDVRRFAGRRVLVVGAGNSGVDALNHLAQARPIELRVSARSWPALFPKRLWGLPVQLSAPLMARLPSWAADAALTLIGRVALGDLTRFGVRPARDGITRLRRDGVAPGIDDGFVAALRRGDILAHPALLLFEGAAAVFADGSRWRPDVVIAATGYRTGLAAMLGHLDALDANERPRWSGGEAHPARPGLWFAGMRPSIDGQFRAARRDAAAIAARVAEAERRAVARVAPGWW